MANEKEPSGDSLKQLLLGRYGVLYRNSTKDIVESKVIDLRSDTVTKPTDEMRVAMFEAEVGDDVLGDDPTAQKLEARAAEILGKEAALYVASGTMGNLICVLTHCSHRGDEVLVGDRSHISIYEQGGVAQIGGVHPRTVRNLPDGTLDLDDLQSKIQPDEYHHTTTRLVCVENTQGSLGGRAIPPDYMDKLAEIVQDSDIKIHVDGARLFNAATALGVPVSKLVEHADSVSMCLSKGLGAPIGSVIAGKKEFVTRARRLRKALGGGMRQVGVIAAPALIALETMSKRLLTDHHNAKRLARGLDALKEKGIQIDVSGIETNIVMFQLVREDMSAYKFVEKLEALEEGSSKQVIVKVLPCNSQLIRAVTHHQVNDTDVELALQKMRRILGG